MAGMSIGEVARKAGLRASAIRYYEKLGLLPKPPRAGGRRQYDHQVLERLAIVRFAKHVGLSVVEIKHLLDGVHGRPPPTRWREIAGAKIAQVDELIAHATFVRQALQQSVEHQCPRLVERGRALTAPEPAPGARVRRRRRR